MSKRKKKNVMNSAADVAEGIRPTIESAVESARDKALPLLHDAKEKATPYLQEGRDLAVEKATQGRDYAAEKAPVLKAAAIERATQGRDYAAEKAPVVKAAAVYKVNELRGIEPEPKKKKGGKLKKLLFVSALLGVAGFLYKKFSGGNSAQANWQSSYVPAPAPAPTPAPTATGAPGATGATAGAAGQRATDDEAAATPGEALADSTDEPRPDTNPDDPAEVINLDPRQN